AELALLRGHSFGIKTVRFSPRMREIIVVGDAQDMMISVWAWPGKVMGSLNKFSDEIYAMDVSANSQYFVTVGNKHVKFYYLELKRSPGNSVSPQCLKIVYGERHEQACHRKSSDAPARRHSSKPPDCLPGAGVSRHRKQGFTVVSVCPVGVHIATGNRHGRVNIYDTNSMRVTSTMHAHEAEITALAYSITHNYKVRAWTTQ
ncbi:mitogen-activated protein kinase-binding protein 1, partial [Elysia marginata]